MNDNLNIVGKEFEGLQVRPFKNEPIILSYTRCEDNPHDVYFDITNEKGEISHISVR
jgi:hypothetical protein